MERKTEMEDLRTRLYSLMRDDASFKEIYDVSVKLDSLITNYYKQIDSEPAKKVEGIAVGI